MMWVFGSKANVYPVDVSLGVATDPSDEHGPVKSKSDLRLSNRQTGP